ncbi:MAG: tRNA (guanosine(37)-N1)-methyltransferase TrmD [Erysipelotrichaceae bacterium]|nr:tRNA (guanosine(37)-N1)-methyltransferase TrmD [Erysipelotrichaceae bacterium]
MKITILTMFPEMFDSFMKAPLVRRAAERHLAEIETIDIRKYAGGSFRHIDDSPYGGGAGMIMRCAPVLDALAAVRNDDSHVILMAPAGTPYQQKDARRLLRYDHVILIAGHYEGVDARVYDHADELVSVGDYILSGGELPAMTITDSLIRLLEGVIRSESTDVESFENGLLEYPQYTKPYDYHGETVPDVLLSGDHAKIARWKHEQSLLWTRKYRPDLLEAYPLSEEDRKFLEEN